MANPIRAFARRGPVAAPEDSLRAIARRMRDLSADAVTIVEDGRFVGVVTESSLARFAAQSDDELSPVSSALDNSISQIAPYESAASALRKLEGAGPCLAVVDDVGAFVGLLRASDLLGASRSPVIPGAVGGMATPFGVYLTTGVVRAGASDLALVSTGILMFCVLLIAVVAGEWAAAMALERHAPAFATEALEAIVQYGLFLGAFRLMPLSGTHAAEHQVVHAIERGEDLEPAVVRRMPRVHPRCGTNIAVGAGLFVALITWNLITDLELRALVALIVAGLAWRPVGSWVQQYLTTKPANDRQLANGIAAGKQLLERTSGAHIVRASIWRRLAMSGIFHVITGALLASAVAWAVARAFHLPLDVI